VGAVQPPLVILMVLLPAMVNAGVSVPVVAGLLTVATVKVIADPVSAVVVAVRAVFIVYVPVVFVVPLVIVLVGAPELRVTAAAVVPVADKLIVYVPVVPAPVRAAFCTTVSVMVAVTVPVLAPAATVPVAFML
jgi:hypothetical protein